MSAAQRPGHGREVVNTEGLNQKLTENHCKKTTRNFRKVKMIQILRKGAILLKLSMHCLKILPHSLPFNIRILLKGEPNDCRPLSQKACLNNRVLCKQ